MTHFAWVLHEEDREGALRDDRGMWQAQLHCRDKPSSAATIEWRGLLWSSDVEAGRSLD
jgi:hypothetical protein